MGHFVLPLNHHNMVLQRIVLALAVCWVRYRGLRTLQPGFGTNIMSTLLTVQWGPEEVVAAQYLLNGSPKSPQDRLRLQNCGPCSLPSTVARR